MLLLALAIAPGLAVCIFIFYRDVHDKEPALNPVMSFFWGMLAILPALAVEWPARELADKSIAGILFSSFILVALVEELAKFLALRYYSFTRKSFDEPLDGIIYSIMVSMGFATLENILYAYSFGLQTAMIRIFTAVPSHATFAVIMGYYTGKARFDFVNRKKLLFRAVLGATLAHGLYDTFLFLDQNDWIHKYIPETIVSIMLLAAAISALIVAILFSLRLTRLHRLTSRQLFHAVPVLTIRHAYKKDIELIRTLALQIWPATYQSILSPAQIRYMMKLIYSPAALTKQMDEGQQFILVYNAGVPIGFASYSETSPGTYKLHKIYLHPKQQGRGSGRFVIEQVARDISPRGAKALQLNVNRNNKAIGFYSKLGFQVIRTEDIDIGQGYFMNDYVMELRLDEKGSDPVLSTS